jgi:hypothetical protein
MYTVYVHAYITPRILAEKIFKEPRNQFQGIDSASVCSPAGRYDNPIPTWCPSPHIDFYKIPALIFNTDRHRKKEHQGGSSCASAGGWGYVLGWDCNCVWVRVHDADNYKSA